MQLGQRKQLASKRKRARLLEKAENLKAGVRAKVEHPLHVIKNPFRYKKARHKWLGQNEGQLFCLFELANLVIAKKSLLALNARDAS